MEKEELKANATREWKCGNLTYTLGGLVAVFAWVMVGGFVYNFALIMPGQMLPIQLGDLHTTDMQKMLILSTVGTIFNMTVCPYVGFVSDRHRGRFGRRIPYILFSLPFLVVSLVLYGLARPIGGWLAGVLGPWFTVAPTTMTIGVIIVITILFQFYYMYPGSVIWYLYNDILPPELFGRINACMQIALRAGAAVFQFFVFRHAREHYTLIFIIGAVVYAVGTLCMCLFVKERTYPPFDVAEGESHSLLQLLHRKLGGIRIFVRESFCHKFYWYRYALSCTTMVAGMAGVYIYFYYREMGFTEADMGNLNGISGILGLVINLVVVGLVAAWSDRWHPVRIVAYNKIFAACGMVFGAFYLFATPSPAVIIIITVTATVLGSLENTTVGVAGLPFEMLTFPKSRFGSFCSMQALLGSIVRLFTGLVVAGIFDLLRKTCPPGSTYYYRYVLVWPIPWQIGVVVLTFLVYREWGRLGGYRSYHCPANWEKDGFEHMDQPGIAPLSIPLLRRAWMAIWGLIGGYVLTVAGGAFLHMHRGDAETAAEIVLAGAACAAVILVAWLVVWRGQRRDVLRLQRGEEPLDGIIHPQMLLVGILCKSTIIVQLALFLWFLSGRGAVYAVAGIGLVLLLFTIAIGVIDRMERGIAILR